MSLQTYDNQLIENLTKNVYKTLIKEVSPLFYSSSIIAGGYMRDWDHGREIKDMDIFIPYSGLSGLERGSLNRRLESHSQIKRVGFDDFGDDDGDEYDDKIMKVYNMDGFALPVQIILDMDATLKGQVLDRFHSTLSKIAFNPKENIIYKSSPYRDAVQSKVNIFRVSDDTARTIEYMDRIKRKYPDYGHAVIKK